MEKYKDRDFNLLDGIKDFENQIVVPPKYLLILLDFGQNNKYKVRKLFFPESLDLTEFVDEICKSNSKKKKYEYNLVSTCSQRVNSGNHDDFIAFCKVNNEKNYWYQWYKYIDADVSILDKRDSIFDNYPYIALYRRE